MCRVRNRKELNASLKGTTLGDVDGDTDDTLKWLKRAKKREKELAKKQSEFDAIVAAANKKSPGAIKVMTREEWDKKPGGSASKGAEELERD